MIVEPGKTDEVVRLGTDFAFEPRIPRLSRGGSVLRLQRVPLQALAVLIEQKGQIVSREHLAEKIWGKGVSLDADNSLNVAIRKLRQALGDNPEAPQYIQTITGQGYRLIASAVQEDAPFALHQPPVATAAAPPVAPVSLAKPSQRLWALYAAVLALAILGGAFWLEWSRVHKNHPPSATAQSMVAVLPFENLTGDQDQDYFSDGLTEEMITQIGNLDPQRLGVIGRTSVMYYKTHPQTLVQIGQDLGVQYAVEGSVRRNQDQARISVRLLRVRDGAIVWTNSFDRSIGDALALQSEIAQTIVGALLKQVLGRSRSHPTRPEVVESYLHGRFELNRVDRQGAAAREYFERAIALDPSYAAAYAGLADFYFFRAVRKDEGSGQAWRLAEQNAARALSLDDQSVEAHVATARVRLMHDWDWQSARQHALRALQLNSSSAEAHAVYATYLRIAGDLPQDLIHRQRALAVDPYREDMKDELASERYFARDFEGVAAAARQNLATDPNNLGDHVTLCMSLEHLHQLAESFAECRKVLVLQGQSDWGNEYAQQYRQHGYKAANLLVAEKRLKTIQAEPHHPDLWELANAYVAAGKIDETFRTLFQCLAAHEPGLLQIRVDPDFDEIRTDPRYADLVRRTGFPGTGQHSALSPP